MGVEGRRWEVGGGRYRQVQRVFTPGCSQGRGDKAPTQFFINVQHNEANSVGGGTWEVGGGSWQVGGEISSNRPERKVCNSWKEKSKACNSWTETYSVI